ncbi:uncharacterized protein LOC123298375 [Chrysoperla carnea]|uniref:uncharacterized protein LOC123298375 n=1 Tax=Chrysoperla carnea TaxID=189513 RepID=UPI001D08B523|nr:uncharacterized protein LOC123298375 [Chrysoperla carnea]
MNDIYYKILIITFLCLIYISQITPLSISISRSSYSKNSRSSNTSCINGKCTQSSSNVVISTKCVNGVCEEQVIENPSNNRRASNDESSTVRPFGLLDILQGFQPNVGQRSMYYDWYYDV